MSEKETQEHIGEVAANLSLIIILLQNRSDTHDASKLKEPEASVFEAVTHKLKGLTYGSEEYFEQLKEMKSALDHHYANNRHHPEHFENGIRGMNIIDLVEMFCDWVAATKRHVDGDIGRSIEINKKRFGYSDDIAAILHNTADIFFSEKCSPKDNSPAE